MMANMCWTLTHPTLCLVLFCKLHVVGYASRTLSPAQARYCIARRELLGVVFGLKKYRQHLLGWPIIV